MRELIKIYQFMFRVKLECSKCCKMGLCVNKRPRRAYSALLTWDAIVKYDTQNRIHIAHIQTWPVFHRGIPISKVWNRLDNICSSDCCNNSKIGKIEEIQGHITQFRLTDFAHIGTWPVFHWDLPISKVWNRSYTICSIYRCNTVGRTDDVDRQTTYHDIISSGFWPES